MKVYKTNEIKNIALMGNDGAGKTTLTEALLYEAGIIKRRGRITQKNTVSDYFPVEQEYGYSVFSTVFHTEWNGKNVRRSNDTSLKDYVEAKGDVPHQTETLTSKELYDELVMTRLRTASGLPLSALMPEQKSYCLQMAESHINAGNLLREGDVLRLSRKGIFISNSIISDLMY